MTGPPTSHPTGPATDVVVGATVFDGVSADLRSDAGIRIRDGWIDRVGPVDEILAEVDPDAVTILDVDGATVLPGLVNMHVHLGLGLPGPAAERMRAASDAELVLVMADSARRSLHAGVTTARLVGERRWTDFALRDAIEAGLAVGPRLFTAGHALCCTGGHGWDADAMEADGADGFRRAARLQLRAGADLLKLCISGGIAGVHEAIDTPQLDDDEMAAVIGVAHDWGRQVTAHAGPAASIHRAIDLGLDGVEHGYELTAELAERMAREGTWYVPTIVVSRCADYFAATGVPEWMVERALGAGPRHWESLQHAIRAGVPIAMGSDMPPFAAFDDTTATVREMEFMVEAGMTALDALRAATSRAATWLGTDQVGRIAPGARADLVAVDGDPTVDIGALRSLHLVVKDGRLARDDRDLAAAGGSS